MSFKGFVFLKSTKLMKPFVGGIFVRIPRCPSSAVKKLEHIFLTYILCKDRGWDQSGTVDFIVCTRSLLLADVGHVILNLCRVCKQGFEDALRFLQKRYLISCTRCLNISSTYTIGIRVYGIQKRKQRSSLLLGGHNYSIPCRASYLHQDDLKNWMNSSFSLYHPGAILFFILSGKEFTKCCSPNRAFAFSSV